ncbi:MAG: TonB-dependent receptor [Selenomonadaceae bacterium]|nr:TonB-dependent receptor [Selenomonadaceae bacterium]
MVSKKTKRLIARAVDRSRWVLPLTVALMANLFLPPTRVNADINEGSLEYLMLVDTFETAERIPTRRLSTPAEVVVITADEIDANHYQSIPEALSHINGLLSGNGLIGENEIPGAMVNSSDRVLVLVNGHRTFMNPPMKAIERIEVVKGGGSALYGSDAVGGIINIITKRGDHSETTIDVNSGSWHRHQYEITTQGNDGKLGWFIDAGIGKSRPYSYRGNIPAGNHELGSDYDNVRVMVRLDHTFDDRNSLTFELMHYSNRYNKYRQQDFVNDLFNYVDATDPKYELDNQLSLTYNFKEGTSTPGFLRYFNNYRDMDEMIFGQGTSRLQGVDYQNGWEFGQHRLIVGAEWHQTSDEHVQWRYAQKKRNNQAYYIQDTITMGKWTLIPGTRLDHNSQFGSQWSPKVAANYSPDDQTKIFASWGRAYQAPNARQLYSYDARWWTSDDVPFFMSMIHGNDRLNPETGHTETIGIEHDFSDKVNMSLSLYNASINNYLNMAVVDSVYANEYDPYLFVWRDFNYVNGEDKQRGIDLTYRQKMDEHWSYKVGYSYTHRDRNFNGESALSNWRAPRNSYKASIRYRNGPWKASLHGMFGSGSDGLNYMEDDFALLDFNISCDVADWATIYAKAINFTNQNRSFEGRYRNAPGRLFQFGLDCRF